MQSPCSIARTAEQLCAKAARLNAVASAEKDPNRAFRLHEVATTALRSCAAEYHRLRWETDVPQQITQAALNAGDLYAHVGAYPDALHILDVAEKTLREIYDRRDANRWRMPQCITYIPGGSVHDNWAMHREAARLGLAKVLLQRAQLHLQFFELRAAQLDLLSASRVYPRAAYSIPLHREAARRALTKGRYAVAVSLYARVLRDSAGSARASLRSDDDGWQLLVAGRLADRRSTWETALRTYEEHHRLVPGPPMPGAVAEERIAELTRAASAFSRPRQMLRLPAIKRSPLWLVSTRGPSPGPERELR